VLLAYAHGAAGIVRYPWDWSPDEGMALDAALRLRDGWAAIYGRTLSPWPWGYGPLLPALLRPVVAAAGTGFLAPRLVAALWTAGLLLAVFWIVRRGSGAALALGATALATVPFPYGFYHLLVRVDGLMCALWLAGAAVLLPERLERGSETLAPRRAVAGGLLLAAASLVKASAALHGLPLVLAWWLVDRRGFVRLAVVTGAAGLAAALLLQWTTGGGFLWASGLWALHPHFPAQRWLILAAFARATAPVLLAAVGVAVAASRCGVALHRQPALVLVGGGLLAIPLLSKSGATWNYLLPLAVAQAVATGVLAGALAARRPAWRPALQAAIGAAALATAVGAPFPVPDEAAARTAGAFYGLVRARLDERPGPLLALRPDYAYVVARQPLAVDGGGSFYHLAKRGVPGTVSVRDGLERAAYPVVVGGPWFFPETGGWMEALDRRYQLLASCGLRYYFGRVPFAIYVPRGVPSERPAFAAGADCRAVPAP
jgi:hypothetical protein